MSSRSFIAIVLPDATSAVIGHRRLLWILLSAVCVAAVAPAFAQQQNWQKQVESSITDVTGPEQVMCPELYESTQTRCQFEGGRACLMKRAIGAAKRGDGAGASSSPRSPNATTRRPRERSRTRARQQCATTSNRSRQVERGALRTLPRISPLMARRSIMLNAYRTAV